MRFRQYHFALGALLSLVLVSADLSAQSTGRITGSVTDSSAAPVAGASVNLYMAGASGVIATTNTTAEGLFSFAAVQAGSYDIGVENPGFSKFTSRGVVVHAAQETSLPAFRLEVKAVEQSVEVTADAQT